MGPKLDRWPSRVFARGFDCCTATMAALPVKELAVTADVGMVKNSSAPVELAMSDGLFSPIRLRHLTLANRIVVAPMCQYSAIAGSATEWHLQHLGSLALSGAGLMMIEATAVEARGRITPHCLGLYSIANEQALATVLQTCRAFGTARIGIQLAHAGRKASVHVPWQGGRPLRQAEGAWESVAPSAHPFAAEWPVPRPL